MSEINRQNYMNALRDFQYARYQASKEEFWARLTGKSTDLLPYEEVREKLRAGSQARKGLQEIPLNAIVGSVGRYSDYTRSFYPRRDKDRERWAGVEMRVIGPEGLPPIEVYKVGEAYFVLDGNHRVSVARQLGADYIEAYVTEVQTKAPLTPGTNMDDLILTERHLSFLERTGLEKFRPQANLTVTVPGQYRILEQHIELHRMVMATEQKREITYQEAVLDWYDNIYLVVVQIIREQNVLKDFPGRTETDIYLWVSGYRSMLADALEWGLNPNDDPQEPAKPRSFWPRAITRLLGLVTPDHLEGGPLPGDWRREQLIPLLQKRTNRPYRLFTNILVPVSGEETGWYALHQALGVARREGGRLMGLHVIPDESEKNKIIAQVVKTRFNKRCAKAGVPGRLAVETGPVAEVICSRARWADLVVIKLNHPPSSQPLARLESGFRTLIRQCSSPLLVVPDDFIYPLDRALLAFDGSPKARQSLYMAAYLATRWEIPLTVLTVADNRAPDDALTEATVYLESHNLQINSIQKSGPVAQAILDTTEETGSNLIIMGGYGHNPLLEIMLGSAVDEVLRRSRCPTLICR